MGWRKLALAALLVGLTVAGCGGDDGETAPTRARFVAQADFICKRLAERSAPIDRRLDRTSDTAKQLALLRRKQALQERALATLQGLGVPDADRQEVAGYVGALKKRRELGRKLESALEREDIPAARSALLEGVAVNRTAYRAATGLGLNQCEAGKPASRRDVVDVFTPDVGVPIELTVEETDLVLTVEAVFDPLEAGGAPPPGDTRLVGVLLLIENSGDASINISLAEQATLTTSRDEQLNPAFLGAGGVCEESLNVAPFSPGSNQRVCIPFQVQKGRQARTFQFEGPGGDAAEWDLTSVKPVSGGTPETGPESSAQTADG